MFAHIARLPLCVRDLSTPKSLPLTPGGVQGSDNWAVVCEFGCQVMSLSQAILGPQGQ